MHVITQVREQSEMGCTPSLLPVSTRSSVIIHPSSHLAPPATCLSAHLRPHLSLISPSHHLLPSLPSFAVRLSLCNKTLRNVAPGSVHCIVGAQVTGHKRRNSSSSSSIRVPPYYYLVTSTTLYFHHILMDVKLFPVPEQFVHRHANVSFTHSITGKAS